MVPVIIRTTGPMVAAAVAVLSLPCAAQNAAIAPPGVVVTSLERLVTKQEARLLTLEDGRPEPALAPLITVGPVRLRVRLALSAPTGFFLHDGLIAIDGLLSDGTRKAATVRLAGLSPFDVTLPPPPAGMEYTSYSIVTTATFGSGATQLRAEGKGTFDARQLRAVEP